MKKLSLIGIVAAAILLPVTASANIIKTGDYVRLGTYRDEPLMWRCVGSDDNGLLMLNNNVICFKSFSAATLVYKGDNTDPVSSAVWAQSAIRGWLNSDAETVNYEYGNPPTEEYVWLGFNAYADEAGFLTNFTDSEKKAIKSVTLKTPLNPYHNEDSDGTYKSIEFDSELNVSEREYDFKYTEDKMFLLDYDQLNLVLKNFDDDFYMCDLTATASQGAYSSMDTSMAEKYFLRVPNMVQDAYEYLSAINFVNKNAVTFSSHYDPYMSIGIRPAFYLADDAKFKSGDGTLDNPYEISETDAIKKHILSVWKTEYDIKGNIVYDLGVKADGKTVVFPDAQPFIDENGRTQVPVHAVSEMLNADVDWDGETRTVTISRDATTVKIVIGSDTVTVDGNAVKMDTAALIKDGRTYIPVRFAAEALGMTVEWEE